MIRFILTLVSTIIVMTSCNVSTQKRHQGTSMNVITDDYELIIPDRQEALLILFPCYPCDAQNTKTEFKISDAAIDNDIAVLMMNYNQHLWLSNSEKENLHQIISDAVRKNDINAKKTFIGGFSSGGNVSLLMSDYLKSQVSMVQPTGVFVVDSPLDLVALYESAQSTVKKNFSEVAIQEAKWIISTFDSTFGLGDNSYMHLSMASPYVSQSKSLENLSNLDGMSIRLYTEPDTTWWRTHRQVEYRNTNAYYLERLADDLTQYYDSDRVEYITTNDKGYRANGERHPHSWSIVDVQDLIMWIMNE